MSKAEEYYRKTRLVETRNWNLLMVFNFAEEYADQENKELTEQLATCQQLREVEQKEKKKLQSQVEDLRIGIAQLQNVAIDSVNKAFVCQTQRDLIIAKQDIWDFVKELNSANHNESKLIEEALKDTI